jgi:hypothetical protein
MKDELTFPPAFEEHLKEIIPDRCKEERENIKAALRQCYHIGVTELRLNTWGSGDSGEDVEIEVYPDNLRPQLTTSTWNAIRYYGWYSTSALNPGYEVNDGGGCRCTITFYPFKIEAETYHYEMIERIGETIKVE